MKYKELILSIAVIFLIVFIWYNLMFSPNIFSRSKNVKFCEKDSDCELNLCRCECYTAGFGPKLICGTNCPAYNITGCKCVDNTCVEIGTYIVPEGHGDIR